MLVYWKIVQKTSFGDKGQIVFGGVKTPSKTYFITLEGTV